MYLYNFHLYMNFDDVCRKREETWVRNSFDAEYI